MAGNDANPGNSANTVNVTKSKAPNFNWNDENTAMFLQFYIEKQSLEEKLSNNKILELIVKDMSPFYEVSAVQLKNRYSILRNEFITIMKHRRGSGNDRNEDEPLYVLLLIAVFEKKHNANPPVLSSSDNGTVVNTVVTPKRKNDDNIEGTESAEEDDPLPHSSETQNTPQSTLKDSINYTETVKTARNKKNCVKEVGTRKILMEMNKEIEVFGKEIATHREESLSLMKKDVENAEDFRKQCLQLKKEGNALKKKKLMLLKKIFKD